MNIVLDAAHNSNGTTYAPNSVIAVNDDTGDWLVGLSAAREIVAGPAAWSAGTYAANNLVTYNGTYYVNTASTSATPGNSPWVAVSYLVSSVAAVAADTVAGRLLDSLGNQYSVSVTTNADGAKVVAVDQTPI